MEAFLVWYQNPRFTEEKEMVDTNYTVCTNNVSMVKYSYQLGSRGSVGGMKALAPTDIQGKQKC